MHKSVRILFFLLFSIFYRSNGREVQLPDTKFHCVYQDKKGFLWLGADSGLYRFDGRNFKRFFHSEKNKNSIRRGAVLCIAEDKKHNLWIGTSTGLSRQNYSNGFFSHFGVSSGLPTDSILDLVSSGNEDLKVITNRGTYQLTYERDEGRRWVEAFVLTKIQSRAVSHTEVLMEGSGILVSLKNNGSKLFINSISKRNKDYVPQIVLTRFYRNGKEAWLGKELQTVKYIRMDEKVHSFGFEFNVLDFLEDNSYTYSYFLDGKEENWKSISSKHEILFEPLASGNYTFKVRAWCSNEKRFTNVASIMLYVNNKSKLNLLLWIFGFGCLGLLIFYKTRKKKT